MPLRVYKFSEGCRKLYTAGFNIISQKESHVKFVKEMPDGKRTAIVPKHREIKTGTLKSILRQAGLSRDDFDEL